MVNLPPIVPEGWAARHRPVVAGFFPETVILRRKVGERRLELGRTEAIWEDLTEPVRGLVQTDSSGERFLNAGAAQVAESYYGRIETKYAPQVGDLLIVVASPDPLNVGTYSVLFVETQGHVVDRTMRLQKISNDIQAGPNGDD